MATKKNSKKASMSTQQKVGIGVGITAAAVAAAGAYFLGVSSDAKKNRTKVKSWMLKAKAEVLETLEDVEEMSQDEYDKLIETVASSYSRLKNASKADIATFKREMKEHWGGIEDAGKVIQGVIASDAAKQVMKRVTKKTPKKATKKVTKKTPKKTAKKTVKKAVKTAKKVTRKKTA